MKAPPYIALIQDGYICIENLDRSTKKSIEHKGLPLCRRHSLYHAIRFAETKTGYFENMSLIERLLDLNELGLVFGEDYKQAYSPAEFMRELQSKGILKVGFPSIYWSAPRKWHIKCNEPKAS